MYTRSLLKAIHMYILFRRLLTFILQKKRKKKHSASTLKIYIAYLYVPNTYI